MYRRAARGQVNSRLKLGSKGSGDETGSLEKDGKHRGVIQGKTHSNCALSREELYKDIVSLHRLKL